MKRRNFIKSSAVLSGLFGILKSASAASWPEIENTLSSKNLSDKNFWKFVRQQFLLPEDYAYFNTGGLGASPYVVLDQVNLAMRTREIKPAPGVNMTKWNLVKEKVAQFIGAQIEEIAFTNSATDGNNIILNGLPFQKGDEIITTTHEHSGLEIPLLNVIRQKGVVVKPFQPDFKNGLGNLERIEQLITKKTRLIFISHFTCTTGQRFPEKQICQLARDKGIWSAFDGAQTAGNMPFDVKEYGCDFYAACCHKWMLGPKRTGFLYVRRDLQDTLAATNVGAYSTSDANLRENKFVPFPTAQRYEFATQNDALYIGLGTAIDFMNKIGREKIWARNKRMAEQLVAGLQKLTNIQILSPAEEEFRTSLITFKVKDKNFRDIAGKLTENGYRVRVVPEANVNGIRVSSHLYNSEEEVARLLDEIKKLI